MDTKDRHLAGYWVSVFSASITIFVSAFGSYIGVSPKAVILAASVSFMAFLVGAETALRNHKHQHYVEDENPGHRDRSPGLEEETKQKLGHFLSMTGFLMVLVTLLIGSIADVPSLLSIGFNILGLAALLLGVELVVRENT